MLVSTIISRSLRRSVTSKRFFLYTCVRPDFAKWYNPAMGKFVPGNFKLRVRRAASGKGLFAEEVIPKGACIVEYTGRPVSESEMYEDRGRYLFWTSKTTMINGNIPSNLARYINHSCAPN